MEKPSTVLQHHRFNEEENWRYSSEVDLNGKTTVEASGVSTSKESGKLLNKMLVREHLSGETNLSVSTTVKISVEVGQKKKVTDVSGGRSAITNGVNLADEIGQLSKLELYRQALVNLEKLIIKEELEIQNGGNLKEFNDFTNAIEKVVNLNESKCMTLFHKVSRSELWTSLPMSEKKIAPNLGALKKFHEGFLKNFCGDLYNPLATTLHSMPKFTTETSSLVNPCNSSIYHTAYSNSINL